MSAVFSIDKSKVKQSFASAANSYDGVADLQREVGRDLLNRFDLTANRAGTIVDIGCGTGFISEQLLLKQAAQQVIAVDIAITMLQLSRCKLTAETAVQYICADAEQLPMNQHSADKIISNLALQWCQDLNAAFTGFKHVLKPQGQLVFSTFGPATLQELKAAWSEVDDYSHVNEFYPAEKVIDSLKQAGFKNIQVEIKSYQPKYQSVIELMRELKGIGAHNILSGRNRKTTSKSTMQAMFKAYEKYRQSGKIIATNEILFVSAVA